MMVDLSEYLAKVQEVADNVKSYRTGGTGKDGTCDCVGLLMGAMYRLGRGEYPYHSSNWFARYMTIGMVDIHSVSDLLVGMLVYKVTSDQKNLNNRYKPGGSCYTGDPLDYKHIGIVVSVSPLRIMHCTSSPVNGINIDEKIGKWKRGGWFSEVSYTNKGDDAKMTFATVVADSGSSVNLRKAESTKSDLIDRVPVGQEVEVLKDSGQWMQIKTQSGKVGFMLSNYLNYDVGDVDETVVPAGNSDRIEELIDTAISALNEIRDRLVGTWTGS